MEWYHQALLSIGTALVTALITTLVTHKLALQSSRRRDSETRQREKLDKLRDGIVHVLQWWQGFAAKVSAVEQIPPPPIYEVKAYLNEIQFGNQQWDRLLEHALGVLETIDVSIRHGNGFFDEVEPIHHKNRMHWEALVEGVKALLDDKPLPPFKKVFPDPSLVLSDWMFPPSHG